MTDVHDSTTSPVPLTEARWSSPSPSDIAQTESGGASHPASARGPWLQLFQPHGFEWNRITLPLAALPAALVGLRIVHLTDFHFRRGWSPVYDQIIRRVQQDPPDLIAITGDFVDNKHNPSIGLPNVLRVLEGLRSRHGCFGVLGNHDGPLGPEIDGRAGIVLLDRQCRQLTVRGETVELIGLPRLSRTGMDRGFIASLPRKTPGIPRLVLSHFSDYVRLMRDNLPDVFLAGHTHGGQVCLPGGFAFSTHTTLPRRYCRGIHRIEGMWFVANRGMGFSLLPIRMFCPAEVIEIRLESDRLPSTSM